MARTRTFLALDVGDAVRDRAAAVQKQLAQTDASVKWVTPDAMHVTLLFLGELDDTDLARVCRTATKVASTIEPFRFTVSGLGAFPNPRRPKVLWAGISEGEDALQNLFAKLEAPLEEQGIYRPEDRPYTPHLTLGRVNDEASGQAIAAAMPTYREWTAGTVAAETLHIMASELRRDGPEYTVIGRAGLAS